MSDPTDLADEKQLEAAMAAMREDWPSLQEELQKAVEAADAPGLRPDPLSPTLAALEEARRPALVTACEDCPNSVWFASPAEVKCYCRVMYLMVWSTAEPNQITHCDGQFVGQEPAME